MTFGLGGERRPVQAAPIAAYCALVAFLATAACPPSPASAAPGGIAPAETLKAHLITGQNALGPARRAAAVPLRGAPPATYAHLKQEAAAKLAARSHNAGASPSTPLGGGIAAAVLGPLNEVGLSAAQEIAAFPGQDVTPPDSTGAIGPNYYLEMVNEEIAVYNRSNLGLVGTPVSLPSFFNGTSPCDPQIKYDPVTERWFALGIRCDNTKTANALYIAFSKSSDPSALTTGWCKYSVSSGGFLEDYPKLGLSSDHIAIGVNEFKTSSGGAFDSARIFSAPKPAAGAISSCPGSLTLTAFGSSESPLTTSVASHVALTPQPATETDNGASGYIVSADEETGFGSPGSHIMIWQLSGGAESPTLTPLGAPAVNTFETPPAVPQPGSTNVIDSLDARLTQAVAATDPAVGNETIFTQHTVAGGAGSVVRWYELVPSTLEVRQSGTITEPSAYAFNGAIAPTGNGGAIITYNTGSASQRVGLWAQSRSYFAPLGTMNSPVELAASSAIDSDFSCGKEACRWGDYAGLSVDPTSLRGAWGSGQINGPTPKNNEAQWATRNFSLGITLFPPTYSKSIGPEAVGSDPTGVAVNSEGDIWVSEWYANTVKELSESGALLHTASLSGPCSGSLNGPFGLAIDAKGNLWVADSGDDRILEFKAQGAEAGTCELQAGAEGEGNGQFHYPTGIAVGPNGHVWVADAGNNRIQELGEKGEFLATFGSLGSGKGQFELPEGVAVDSRGRVWVAEVFGGRVQELSESGAYLGQLQASLPSAVAIDQSGSVWVPEFGTGQVRQYEAATRELVSAFGSEGWGEGQFRGPRGPAVDSTRGNLWLADEGGRRLEKWTTAH
jgi:streptogramin lyase